MTSPHHTLLLQYGFLESSEYYYVREHEGVRTNCLSGPRAGVYMWQVGRRLLQADVVTPDALEQVLQREFGGIQPTIMNSLGKESEKIEMQRELIRLHAQYKALDGVFDGTNPKAAELEVLIRQVSAELKAFK